MEKRKKIICDFDTVDDTNINRQVVANTKTIGLYKTDCLEKMILDINPKCNVTKLTKRVDFYIYSFILDNKYLILKYPNKLLCQHVQILLLSYLHKFFCHKRPNNHLQDVE